MAKQRRNQPRTPVAKEPTPGRPSRVGQSTKSSATTGSPAPAAPRKRTTYIEAVALYERGLQSLQRHDYERAATIFQSVLDLYPEEKELHERVRLYVKVCERQLGPADATPKNTQERVYAATVAINKGAYDDGLEQLRHVERDDPENDHAQYMLAVVHALRGDRHDALVHLQRAIDLNPDNRSLARTDPDLEPLGNDERFRAALHGPNGPRRDRRPPARHRAPSR